MKLQVGVKLLIKNNQDKFLFIQRSEPLPDGTGIKWDIPGGRIDASERLEDALKRELLEEIGVTLDQPVQLIAAQDIVIEDVELHVVRLTYTTDLSEDVVLGDEHQDLKWATLQESISLNVDPYLRAVLEAF